MGARLINRKGLKHFRPSEVKEPLTPHICGRAKVIARKGNNWTIQCRTGCRRMTIIDITSPKGKEWLVATGRVKSTVEKVGKD